MTCQQWNSSLAASKPPENISAALEALWWDAKGDWAKAHSLVDELETTDGMAVHAYLHRKEGELGNADYWYKRAGRQHYREDLEAERSALVEALLQQNDERPKR